MSKKIEASDEILETKKTEWTEPELKKIDMVEKTEASAGNTVDASGSTTIG